MMKGYNSMELNEATMIIALQYYLSSIMVGNVPQVTGVEQLSGMTKTFKVGLEAVEQEKP